MRSAAQRSALLSLAPLLCPPHVPKALGCQVDVPAAQDDPHAPALGKLRAVLELRRQSGSEPRCAAGFHYHLHKQRSRGQCGQRGHNSASAGAIAKPRGYAAHQPVAM